MESFFERPTSGNAYSELKGINVPVDFDVVVKTLHSRFQVVLYYNNFFFDPDPNPNWSVVVRIYTESPSSDKFFNLDLRRNTTTSFFLTIATRQVHLK